MQCSSNKSSCEVHSYGACLLGQQKYIAMARILYTLYIQPMYISILERKQTL